MQTNLKIKKDGRNLFITNQKDMHEEKSIKLYKSEEYKNSKDRLKSMFQLRIHFSGFGEMSLIQIIKTLIKGGISIKNICLVKCISGKFISFY